MHAYTSHTRTLFDHTHAHLVVGVLEVLDDVGAALLVLVVDLAEVAEELVLDSKRDALHFRPGQHHVVRVVRSAGKQCVCVCVCVCV